MGSDHASGRPVAATKWHRINTNINTETVIPADTSIK